MKSLKLNSLESSNLSKRELSNVKGGNWICTCSCYYEGQPGGSSTMDNGCANGALGPGGHSKDGDNQYTVVVCN